MSQDKPASEGLPTGWDAETKRYDDWFVERHGESYVDLSPWAMGLRAWKAALSTPEVGNEAREAERLSAVEAAIAFADEAFRNARADQDWSAVIARWNSYYAARLRAVMAQEGASKERG